MAKQSLTKALIRNASPRKSKYVIWDTRVPNFGVRIYPSDSKSYILRLSFRDSKTGKSRERFHTVGNVHDYDSPDDARDRALEIRREYRSGIDVKTANSIEESKLITLREVLIGYFISREPNNKERTLTDTCSGIRKSFGHLLDTSMIEITADDVLDAYRTRKEKAPVRVGVDARYFRSVWNWTIAARPDLDLDECPISRITALKEWPRVKRRKGRLTKQTAPTWMAATCDLKQTRESVLFQLLYYTGIRIDEALQLSWSDVDLDISVPRFRLRDTKTRNDVELPISRQLKQLLKSWRANSIDTGLLFPAVARNGKIVPASYPGKVIKAHRENCGTYWSANDLRRTFITAGELAGVPSVVVRRLTNHAISTSDAHDGYIVAHCEDLIEWTQQIADLLQSWADPGASRPMSRAEQDYYDGLQAEARFEMWIEAKEREIERYKSGELKPIELMPLPPGASFELAQERAALSIDWFLDRVAKGETEVIQDFIDAMA